MKKQIAAPAESILVYQTEDGHIRVDVRMDAQTVWLSQAQMAALFDTTKQNVGQHVRNVFSDGELQESAVVKDFFTTATDGKQYNTRHYNLDVIISVGYRVKSLRGTQFRIWATRLLHEYLTKGFALDDKRLKESSTLDRYFDELVERIRDIRTSERQFYRKVADIYATSIDYDVASDQTSTFYATVQNKFHFAITGHTAAEIIAERADAKQTNMGLTNWPGTRILARDVTVAKNYLTADELRQLNNTVEQYLIFAEGQAQRRISMKMADWISKLHGFLTLNDRDILQNAGKISKQLADERALLEFEKFRSEQGLSVQHESDFDRVVKQITAPASRVRAREKPQEK
jgi:hypothetical protein